MFVSPFHKLGPDWKRRFGAFKLQVLIIIKANPDDAQQLRGKSSEPSILERTRFSCGRKREAATSHSCASAAAEHFLHERDHQEVHARIQNAFGFGLGGPERVPGF